MHTAELNAVWLRKSLLVCLTFNNLSALNTFLDEPRKIFREMLAMDISKVRKRLHQTTFTLVNLHEIRAAAIWQIGGKGKQRKSAGKSTYPSVKRDGIQGGNY